MVTVSMVLAAVNLNHVSKCSPADAQPTGIPALAVAYRKDTDYYYKMYLMLVK